MSHIGATEEAITMASDDTAPVAAPERDQRDWFSEWPAMMAQRWPDLFGGRLPDFFDAGLGRHGIRVEEHEQGDRLVIRAELPDVDPDEDIDITVSDHRLRLRARRERRSEVRDDDRFRSEFSYGSFERTVPLPATATEDDVEAVYRDGILEISVPLADDEDAVPKRIPITKS
ncbi:MAG: Hsp20/alpha crystallin family protein [Actinomycetota bacterium]